MRVIIILMLLSLSSYASAETNSGTTNTIKATVGKEFVITLDANATTGYEWQLAAPIDDKLINLVSSEYVPYETGLVGSGGKSVWTFKAIQAGKAQISFKYIRSWEKDITPENRVMYVADIQESVKASETVKKEPDVANAPYWQEDFGEPSFGPDGDEGYRQGH
jgi:inhibitor of cysteine peptidase